jgi:hypothetical protein
MEIENAFLRLFVLANNPEMKALMFSWILWMFGYFFNVIKTINIFI